MGLNGKLGARKRAVGSKRVLVNITKKKKIIGGEKARKVRKEGTLSLCCFTEKVHTVITSSACFVSDGCMRDVVVLGVG